MKPNFTHIYNPSLLPKKLFEFVAKRSNNAQAKNFPTIIKDVVTGRDPSFYSTDNTVDGGNEIDTYLYGVPYGTEFTGDPTLGPQYNAYVKKAFPNQNIKTYNAHFADTLYVDNSAKEQINDLIKSGQSGGGVCGRYAKAPSYPVTTKQGRLYDAGGHRMTFGKDSDGNVGAHMGDVYDFYPDDWRYSNGSVFKKLAANAANTVGTPFIVRQNNIPVVFKEIMPQYKTDLQRDLGGFLSQWGDYYDLSAPLDMSDEQIKYILDDPQNQSGDDILRKLSIMGFLRLNNGQQVFSQKDGGIIPLKRK